MVNSSPSSVWHDTSCSRAVGSNFHTMAALPCSYHSTNHTMQQSTEPFYDSMRGRPGAALLPFLVVPYFQSANEQELLWGQDCTTGICWEAWGWEPGAARMKRAIPSASRGGGRCKAPQSGGRGPLARPFSTPHACCTWCCFQGSSCPHWALAASRAVGLRVFWFSFPNSIPGRLDLGAAAKCQLRVMHE